MPLIITRGAASAKGFGFAGFVGKAPGAPTIGTATAGNALACVAFTAPSCTGIPPGITGYQATCVATGTHTATGSSSPIQITGLTNCTAYTFKVRATNSVGYGAYSGNSNSVTPTAKGSQSYTTPGTYSWVAPAGVTSVSVVAIGGGGGGGTQYSPGGGGLGYKNNISVTPGNSYTVVVGSGGIGQYNTSTSGYKSYFISCSSGNAVGFGGGTPFTYSGGSYYGDGGGNGGCGAAHVGGGGGAGGYSGNGGSSLSYNGTSGSGGGGGGGGKGCFYYVGCCCFGTNYYAASGGGGGVGLFGQGSNGAGGAYPQGYGGGGGSGGGAGGNGRTKTGYPPPGPSCGNWQGGAGGTYGGGGGAGWYAYSTGGCGASGAVRIVWPGNTRTFPSTCVGTP